MPRRQASPLEKFINGFLDLEPTQREAVLETCEILQRRNQAALTLAPGDNDGNTAPAKKAKRRRRTRAEIAAMEQDPGQTATVGS